VLCRLFPFDFDETLRRRGSQIEKLRPLMKTSLPLLASTLALSCFTTGCVGTGPNTQQGAVTGGAIGAIAGAVLGNNSRGGDALGGAILGGTVGAIAGGAIGNSVDQQNGTVYGAPRRRSRVVYQDSPPPPPPKVAETVSPSPAANAVWIPGFWDYTGSSYIWNTGHWEIPPPVARQYVSPHWENRGGTYVWVRGYWVAGGS